MATAAHPGVRGAMRGWAARAGQMLLGLGLLGVGLALVLRSHLGMVPLDVLHVAIARHTGWTVGTAIIVAQAALVVVALAILLVSALRAPATPVTDDAESPRRTRHTTIQEGRRLFGPATLGGVLMPGLLCDATLAVVPDATGWAARAGLLLIGGLLFGIGSACYLGARIGSIPRDCLIMWLVGRGHSLAVVRWFFDIISLALGWALLGLIEALHTGTVGVGSIVLALGLAPLIARLRPRFDRELQTTAPADH